MVSKGHINLQINEDPDIILEECNYIYIILFNIFFYLILINSLKLSIMQRTMKVL